MDSIRSLSHAVRIDLRIGLGEAYDPKILSYHRTNKSQIERILVEKSVYSISQEKRINYFFLIFYDNIIVIF